MGAWGTKLYDDDSACDFRDEYIKLLKEHKDNNNATKILIENNLSSIEDIDEAPLFWLALADTQWKWGRLLPEVKEKALHCINNESNLNRWKENEKDYKKRKEVLEHLRKQLESEQPKEKRIVIRKPYINEWNIGDLFALELTDDYAKEKKLDGRYLLLYKIGNRKWINDNEIPLMYVKITPNKKIPTTIKEINKCEYIIMGAEQNSKYDKIPPKILRKKLSEDIRFILKYEIVDYRTYIESSKRSIPKNLIYLGNFKNIEMPKTKLNKLSEEGGCYQTWFNLQMICVDLYLYNNKKLTAFYDKDYLLYKSRDEKIRKKYDIDGHLKPEYYDPITFERKD